MKCRFREYNDEGDFTDTIYAPDGVDAPDWVEVELRTPIHIRLAKTLLEANPDFKEIALTDSSYSFDLDEDWGNWNNDKLTLTRWGGAYLTFQPKHGGSCDEIEVDVTGMVNAYLNGEISYDPEI